ncbi:MAG TPA: hypothetical protein VE222_11545 [Nitrospiraceae bacterium]|jgi:hypothetical protein|nr:hypothetical protein [Nitrospiraceae bacterium]
MNFSRRRPQYVDLLPLTHLDDLASAYVQSARRAWWLSLGIMLLVFLLSLVLA